MAGFYGIKVLPVFFGLSSFLLLAQPLQKTTSIADCTYQVDQDKFLSAEGRARSEVNDRVLKVARAFAAVEAPSPATAPESIPQRNVVDQEIFGKLIKM